MIRMQWAVSSLVGLFVLAGCSSYHHRDGMMEGSKSEAHWQKGRQDMADLIDRTVKDQGKAEQVKAITDDIVTELKAGWDQDREYHRQLYQLNANYQATPEEFMKIMDEANNHRMRSATKVLGLRFKMKELMTPEEWKSLSDQMATYSGRYQHGTGTQKSGY
jgi:hypothetical protein